MNSTQQVETALPETLTSGQQIRFPQGLRAIVTRTSKRNDYDEPLYRLIYQRHISNGWVIPTVASSRLYTVEDLQEMGGQIAE